MNLRVSRIVPHFIVASFLFALTPGLAAAAWQANGIPVTSPEATIYQSGLYLCPDGSSGAYVLFSKRTVQEPGDTYLQRVTADGDIAPGWPAAALPVGVGPNTQFPARLTPDIAGGAFVVWSSNENGPNVDQHYLQKVLPNGTIAPNWPAGGLRLPLLVFASAVCADGEGGAILVWTTAGLRLVMLHYGADGQLAPGWSATPRALTTGTAEQGLAKVLPVAGGGLIAVWVERRLGSYYYFATKILPSGDLDPSWPPAGSVPLTSSPAGTMYSFSTLDGAGGLYVAWSDYRNGPFPFYPPEYWYDVYGQHVLANGTVDPAWPVNGAPIIVGSPSRYDFEMVGDGTGGMNFVSSGRAVVAVRIRPNATVAPGWTPNGAPVATNAVFRDGPSTAVGTGDGGVYAFWISYDSGSVFGQRLGPNGSAAPGWAPTAPPVATGSHFELRAISDGADGAIVAFQRGFAGSSRKIYAQRVRTDGPVPIRISFLDSEVGPGTARLRWAASDAPGARATVYRRQLDDPWIEIGTPVSVGESVLEFEDRNVMAGRYGYRLGIIENGLETFTEEVVLDIPIAFALALAGFQPNPAVGAVSVAFTLPSNEPATVTVHDVRGRVIGSRDVSALGAGSHRIDMSDRVRFAPGVYWLLLAQGGRVLQSRGVILR